MNTDADLRDHAVALRRAGLSRRQIRDRLGIRSDERLGRLLQGEPPPAWTRRPRAKDDLREKARELRAEGRTYDEISTALGVSKSSVSLWVRDLPRPAPRMTPQEKARHMSEVRWGPLRRQRDEERQATKAAATAEIGELSDRGLFLTGVALYWAEGAKDKPWHPAERVILVNSDPDVIRVFLAWSDLLGVEPERRRYAVNIHETADIAAAEDFWRRVVGADASAFTRASVKRRNPKTNRKADRDTHHGCLRITVLRGAELYRRVEGWWCGIVGGAVGPGRESGAEMVVPSRIV